MNDAKREHPVGMIGLGIMGGAIGRNLVAGGRRVIGYDIDRARCDEAEADGLEIARDAAEVAQRARHVLLSLPNPHALHATAQRLRMPIRRGASSPR